MKTRRVTRLNRARGYTLMELLIVISLIAILAAMVIAAAGGIMKASKRKEILNFVAELENGLEQYKVDNGIYPLSPERRETGGGGGGGGVGTGTDTVASAGSRVLYKHLSGDYDLDGQIDDGVTVYVQKLDYWSNSNRGSGQAPSQVRSAQLDSGYIVIDPLGSPMRYLAAPYGLTKEHEAERKRLNQRNPTYDLWSIAGADPSSPDFSDESNWITNWGTN